MLRGTLIKERLYDTAISLIDIDPKEIKTFVLKFMYGHMSKPALFIISKK